MNLEIYARLCPETRLYALGLMPQEPIRSFEELGRVFGRPCANVTLLERSAVLDTKAATRAKVEKAPYPVQAAGRAALAHWIEPLAAYLAKRKPPRGLETVLRGLDHQQLALMALRAALDRIHVGWDEDRHKPKQKIKNPDRHCCQELGRRVRDELEFAGLFIAKPYVKAARIRHAALGRLKFRRVDWTNAECAQVGDWLWKCLDDMSCFDKDEHGFLCIHADHKAALDKFAEDHLYDHPLYKPRLEEPPAWTDWRVECPGDIGATFVKVNDPETVEQIKAAFADDSIKPHARAVSAIQSVPLKINPAMLPLVREFAGDEHRRDVVMGEELVRHPRFWNRVRCDRRGRLIQMCDFNYTRGDPVRSLFMFAEGNKIGNAIDWLEIAIANAYGVKGTKPERHRWLANNRELIKAVSVDPGLICRRETGAKEPYQFAAACIEYVAADMHGPEYETHLPVWLDASSNGLQHIAIMRRDVQLAEMVNLRARPLEYTPGPCRRFGMPKDDPNYNPNCTCKRCGGKPVPIHNVYEIVALHGRQTLRADDDPIWRDLPLDSLRELLKRPIMTLPYGVTRRGMLDQIQETCEELGIEAPFEALVRLRDHVWKAIEEKLPGAMETREYIQAIARRCLDHGSSMQWVTRSGFPVANRYRTSKTRRVRLPFLGQAVTIADGYTDELRKQKTINSAVANVTHSSDAAHLALSVNGAVEEGITNIMTIHGCFGALAPDVTRFARIRRWQLTLMCLNYNPLERLRDNLPPGTNDLSLPDFDPEFDLLSLGESEYFDR